MRRLPPLAAILLLAVVAGCGSGSSSPYTADGTKACLAKSGFTKVTTDAKKVGFIAAFSANGGLQARSPHGNVLTIAFTDSPESVAGVERAYRKAAPPRLRPHIGDIMESQRNAVLVWTVSPRAEELTAVQHCLAS